MALACDSESNLGKASNNNQPELADSSLTQIVHSIYDKSLDAVFGVDASGKLGYWNDSCKTLFGYEFLEELQTKRCSDLLCGGDSKCDDKCCTQCAINKNMETEQQINDYQISIKQADGQKVKVNIGTCYFYQDDPEKTSTYFTIREIETA